MNKHHFASIAKIRFGDRRFIQSAARSTVCPCRRTSPIVRSAPKIRGRFVQCLGMLSMAAGIVASGDAAWQAARADEIAHIDARVVAIGIPGASAIAQIGAFLNVPPPGACANPIPAALMTRIVAMVAIDCFVVRMTRPRKSSEAPPWDWSAVSSRT